MGAVRRGARSEFRYGSALTVEAQRQLHEQPLLVLDQQLVLQQPLHMPIARNA
jgi:hypothetical protein